MNLFLKQVRVLDPSSPFHNQLVNIQFDKGKIVAIGKSIKSAAAAQIIDEKGICISPSFTDLHVDFCDPGYEHRETIESGLAAAEAGGYGNIVQMPGTMPVVQSKSEVEYILSKADGHKVQLHVAGAASRDLAGTDLTEMHDMKLAGARFFTNDKKPAAGSDLLELALRYTASIGSFLAVTAQDPSFMKVGQVYESPVSTKLGLKGIPKVSEAVALDRIIRLADLNKVAVHVMSVSTKEGVEIIAKAKAKGIKITADCNATHLLLCDEDLMDFDSNLKLSPPLGSKEDQKALKAAVLKGTIDFISSDHRPIEIEGKACEFELARFGMIGLQTAFSTCVKALGADKIQEWLPRLYNANQLIGLKTASVDKDGTGSYAIFNLDQESILTNGNNLSLSSNSYFMDKSLPGKVVGVL